MRNTPQTLLGTVSALILSLGLAASAAADDFKWPRMTVIGTPGTASGSFASTNGWAPVFQEQAGSVTRVIPEGSETQRFVRMTERSDFALISAAGSEMALQIQGQGGYVTTEPVATRLFWHHMDTPFGFVMAGGSDINTIEDIRENGARISVAVSSPAMTLAAQIAFPAFLRMTPEEAEEKLTFVPASSYAENCRSVVEGKADVTFCSPISSVTSEMEGAPGSIKWLNMDLDNTEGWAEFLEHRPMIVPSVMNLGVKTSAGVAGLTTNILYIANADLDEELAYNMAKWMHTSYDDYKDTHFIAARMSAEQFRAYLDRSPLPVHDGTIRYLREIGMWTEADDEWNAKAVEQMDSWLNARRAALAEAREKGVPIDAENEEFMQIMKSHTEGLEPFKVRI